MTSRSDVVIVGGGVIGCALARELAWRGASVTLIERGEPGGEASGVAAGMLAPQAEAVEPGPFLDLALESRAVYAAWTDALYDETGIDVGYRKIGLLRCAFPPGSAGLERFLWQRGAGLPMLSCGASEIASYADGRVTPDASEALFFPEEAAVDSKRLIRALCVAAEQRGASIRSGVRAKNFLVERGVCRGVETTAGPFAAEVVVDAAGAWAGFDSGLGISIPVGPVRGQLVELVLTGPPLPTIIESEEVYLVPRADGSLVAGATAERVGFEKRTTAGAVAGLIEAAARLVPSVGSAHFLGAWAGLRPATPDGLPLLGPSPIPGLHLATGHFRNGVLLAPVTARLLADCLAGRTPRELAPFSIGRFAERRRSRPGAAVSPGVFG